MPDLFATSIDGTVPSVILTESSGPDNGLMKLWVNETGAAGGWRRAGLVWHHDGTDWRIAKRPGPPPDTSVAAGVDLTRVAAGELEVRVNADAPPWWGLEIYIDYEQRTSGFPAGAYANTAGPYYVAAGGTACLIQTLIGLNCGFRHVVRARFRYTDYLTLGTYTSLAQYGAQITGGGVAISAINFFC